MTKISVEVCPNYWDGTNDFVRLRFKTCPHTDSICNGTRQCVTDWLDDAYDINNSWQNDQTYDFFADELGKCARVGKLGSVDQLFVQAEVQAGDFLDALKGHDVLKLCKIKVEFGFESQSDFSQWNWSGEEKTHGNSENNIGQTNWMETIM